MDLINLLNLSRTKRGNEVGSILDWLRWRRGEIVNKFGGEKSRWRC